jgi:CheY-like chemotaxis protein
MNKRNFIIIDDDPISNSICSILFMKFIPNINILTFTLPEEAFEFIISEYSRKQHPSIVLFLDINMPVMTGWDFLKRFEEQENSFKSKFKIYMMSSSIDQVDKKRAFDNKYVIDLLLKPLTKKTLLSIFI